MGALEIKNLSVITEVCDAFNRHDAEGILDHFVEDAAWLLSRGVPPDGQTLIGKSAIRDMLHQRFGSIPDMAWNISSHWVGGNRGCSEWRVTGTEANGSSLNWLGCDLWELNADSKVIRKDTYWKYSGGEY